MDNVNHPKHYTVFEPEVIEIIERYRLGYHLGNVLKYLLRAPYKGEEKEDLEKAKWYLDRYISHCLAPSHGTDSLHNQEKRSGLVLPELDASVQSSTQESMVGSVSNDEQGEKDGFGSDGHIGRFYDDGLVYGGSD